MSDQNIVHAVTDATFERDVIKYNGVCVVKFYRDQCGPCRHIKNNYIYEAKHRGQELRFYEYDCATNNTVAQKLGISGYPHFLFFKDGRVVHRHEGAPGDLNLTPVIDAGLAAQ